MVGRALKNVQSIIVPLWLIQITFQNLTNSNKRRLAKYIYSIKSMLTLERMAVWCTYFLFKENTKNFAFKSWYTCTDSENICNAFAPLIRKLSTLNS